MVGPDLGPALLVVRVSCCRRQAVTACKAQAAAATAGKAEVAAAQALAAHRLVYTLSFFPYLFAFLKLKAMCHKFHHIIRSIFTPEPTVHKGKIGLQAGW